MKHQEEVYAAAIREVMPNVYSIPEIFNALVLKARCSCRFNCSGLLAVLYRKGT